MKTGRTYQGAACFLLGLLETANYFFRHAERKETHRH